MEHFEGSLRIGTKLTSVGNMIAGTNKNLHFKQSKSFCEIQSNIMHIAHTHSTPSIFKLLSQSTHSLFHKGR